MRIKTRAERNGDEYLICGEKRNITNGSNADVLLVWAITNPEVDPAKGMSVFIFESDAKGFEVERDYELLGGFPGTVNSYLRFDDVRIHGKNMLGGENEGARVMFDELSIERALYASMLVGEARPILELAVEYSKDREQFGTTISRFEGISFKIADMATKLEAAKLMVYHTVRLIDAGFDAEQESAMAKLLASEAFYEVAHNTVQILGGRGLTDEYPAEWAFRMARLSMIPAGTNEIMRFIVQREVYKGYKAEKGR
jgi:alkylation response protein AidB-like acyl-CoA dehydrogenase